LAATVFLYFKVKTAPQPWQAIAQRFCSIPFYLVKLKEKACKYPAGIPVCPKNRADTSANQMN